MKSLRLLALLAAAVLAVALRPAAAAVPCTKPKGYSGAMVLPKGSSEPDHCTPEFPGDGARTFLEYDIIRMPPATLTARAGVATVEACQAQCRDAVGAADGCQYFFFNGSQPVAKRCLLRLKGVAPPNFTAGVPSKAAVLFEVLPGRYSAYAADPLDWAGLGSDIASYANLRDALRACAQAAACVGLKYDPSKGGARPWKAFSGTLWEGVVGKVRTTGPSLNPWARYL